MDADIVARLREEGFITHMARLPRESKILHDSADEIERLRKELALALVERDAARLEVCLLRASAGVVSASTDADMEAFAKSRGWDFTDASTETRPDGAKRVETDTDDGA